MFSSGSIEYWDCFLGEKMQESPKDTIENSYTWIGSAPLHSNIVATTNEFNILFYDMQSMKRTRQIIGFLDEITDVKFMPNSKHDLLLSTNSEKVCWLKP